MSKNATTAESIERIHAIVSDDPRVKVHETAEAIGILKERVCYVLHEELHMKTLCASKIWNPYDFQARILFNT